MVELSIILKSHEGSWKNPLNKRATWDIDQQAIKHAFHYRHRYKSHSPEKKEANKQTFPLIRKQVTAKSHTI